MPFGFGSVRSVSVSCPPPNPQHTHTHPALPPTALGYRRPRAFPVGHAVLLPRGGRLPAHLRRQLAPDLHGPPALAGRRPGAGGAERPGRRRRLQGRQGGGEGGTLARGEPMGRGERPSSLSHTHIHTHAPFPPPSPFSRAIELTPCPPRRRPPRGNARSSFPIPFPFLASARASSTSRRPR